MTVVLVIGGLVVVLLAGGVVWALFAWRHAGRSPIALVEVTEPDRARDEEMLRRMTMMPAGYYHRRVVIQFRELDKAPVRFGLGSYEMRRNGQWTKWQGFVLPTPLPPFVAGGYRTNRLDLNPQADVDRLRVTLPYYRLPSSRWPFGIGNFNARFAARGTARSLQTLVKKISPKLFDELWPAPPIMGLTNGWKIATLEVEVHEYTNGAAASASYPMPPNAPRPAGSVSFSLPTNILVVPPGMPDWISNMVVTQRLAMLARMSNHFEAHRRVVRDMHERMPGMTNDVPGPMPPLASVLTIPANVSPEISNMLMEAHERFQGGTNGVVPRAAPRYRPMRWTGTNGAPALTIDAETPGPEPPWLTNTISPEATGVK